MATEMPATIRTTIEMPSSLDPRVHAMRPPASTKPMGQVTEVTDPGAARDKSATTPAVTIAIARWRWVAVAPLGRGEYGLS